MALSRRALVRDSLLLVPALAAGRAFAAPAWRPIPELAELEGRHGGRLGVCVLDTGTKGRAGQRMDERFAMCSTFKAMLAAFVLARVDRGEEKLDRALPVTERDLVPNSPVTSKRVGGTMTLAELCHATVTISDNAAANLILGVVGGPPAVTAFARSLGDTDTRLDRIEPEMNLVDLANGDERDTTTPDGMATTLHALTLGGALRPASTDTLVGWLRATVTGNARLRAGLPAAWLPGDKTGTGMDGPTNDIAVAWPPGRGAIVVTAYYDRPGRKMDENAVVLAEVGRIVAGMR